MRDCSLTCSPGFGGGVVFSSARFGPNPLMTPVRVMLGGGGLLSSGLGGGGGSLRLKTLRTTIPWYGLVPASGVAPTPKHSISAPAVHSSLFSSGFII